MSRKILCPYRVFLLKWNECLSPAAILSRFPLAAQRAPAVAVCRFSSKQLLPQNGVTVCSAEAGGLCGAPSGPGGPPGPAAASAAGVARESPAGPGPRGREPPGPCANGCGGMALPGRSRSVTGWKFSASPGRELGLKGSFIAALPAAADTGSFAAASPGPGAPPARTMRRSAAAAAPLLLLALLLAAAPPAGRSESPKGKQKALRQREVVDMVRGSGGGRGWGGSAASGRWAGARAAGRDARLLFYCKDLKKAKTRWFSKKLVAAPVGSGLGSAGWVLSWCFLLRPGCAESGERGQGLEGL